MSSTTDSLTGHYFEIYVPDYDPATSTLDSYLRLGKPLSDAASETGITDKTLWAQFTGFKDQDTAAGDDPLRDRTGESVRDWSGRDNAKATFYQNLGWRDHSDGNRLTTTGGDKVEIIQGNYQLIVLGRAASADDGVVLDASGGHLWSGDIAPGAVTRTEYKTDKFAGTWKITEETIKGHVHEIFRGEFLEEFRGSTKESIVGQATEGTADWDKNPAIIDRTWARSIEEYVGTSGHAVPAITAATYATTVNETTSVSTITSTTLASTSVTDNVGSSSAKVPAINENVYATTITSNTMASTINETFGELGSLDMNHVSTHYGNVSDFIYGSKQDFMFGGVLDIFFGGSFRLVVAKEIDILLALHTEIHVGAFAEITLGFKQDIVVGKEVELNGENDEVSVILKQMAIAIFLG